MSPCRLPHCRSPSEAPFHGCLQAEMEGVWGTCPRVLWMLSEEEEAGLCFSIQAPALVQY